MFRRWLRVPISAFASGSCFGIIVPMGLIVEHHQIPAPEPVVPARRPVARSGGRALPRHLRCTEHSRPAQAR